MRSGTSRREPEHDASVRPEAVLDEPEVERARGNAAVDIQRDTRLLVRSA
jgi:hypothetical protein